MSNMTSIEKFSRFITLFWNDNIRTKIKQGFKLVITHFRKHIVEITIGVTAAVLAIQVAFPAGLTNAQVTPQLSQNTHENWIALMVKTMQNQTKKPGSLPKAGNVSRKRTIRIPITAYSSEPWQTSGDPFVTAAGTHVRDGVVAANFLPIGTRVRIPELYGDKVFVVEDRMNERYFYKMDIWMDNTPEAVQFGLKHAEIEIYPSAPVNRIYSGARGARK